MMESSANTVKAGHSVTGSTGSLGLSGGGGRGAIFYCSYKRKTAPMRIGESQCARTNCESRLYSIANSEIL